MKTALDAEVIRLHEKACLNQQDFYIDPKTGYSVMTAYFLKRRGYCCGNDCRHCPYVGTPQKVNPGLKKGDS